MSLYVDCTNYCIENSLIGVCNTVKDFLIENKGRIVVAYCAEPTFSDRHYETHRTYINKSCNHAKETFKINYSFSLEVVDHEIHDKDNSILLKRIEQLINSIESPIEDISFYEEKEKENTNLLKINIPFPIVTSPTFESPKRFILNLKIGQQTCWVNGKQVNNEEHYRVCEDSRRFWDQHPTYVDL